MCVCVCVLARGGYQGEEKKNPPLSYMHMAVHQLIAGKSGGLGGGGKENEGKLVYSPPCGRPVFLCERRLTLFWRDEGWEGPAGGV